MKTMPPHQTQWIQIGARLSSLVGLALVTDSATFVLAGPADDKDKRAPQVPEDIAVPAGNKVHFHAFGRGGQIYTWNGSTWGAAVPEATLFDAKGHVVATHN